MLCSIYKFCSAFEVCSPELQQSRYVDSPLVAQSESMSLSTTWPVKHQPNRYRNSSQYLSLDVFL